MFIIALLVCCFLISLIIELFHLSPVFSLIGVILSILLLYILYYMLAHLYQKTRTIFTKHIKSWKARKYMGETTGEVIENKRTEQIQWMKRLSGFFMGMLVILGGKNSSRRSSRRNYETLKELINKEHYKELVYSTTVQYEVRGKSYTVDLDEYDYTPEIIGRPVKILYDENEPSRAYAWMKRKCRKHIRITRREGMYVYCECGLRKNIELLSELVDDRAMPGMLLVEKYGYYHLVEAEERKKSFMEVMEDSIKPGAFEDSSNHNTERNHRF